ncbi:uncharacterized protein LOC110634760 isoform X2 [Hevea brasiliensis]|uniref:uncharacterized protein LOC110634760 isoform X2 n=1 Tax=Hevea brasiliensis TaxID=3981 RepID=UPI0025CD7393|nr:uncharacterized protein LOC110634760 isoform X2 [Hevea brasiliensis]
MTHWSTLEWIAKSRIAAQNWRSGTDGSSTDLSKHIGGSSSIVEHNLKMAEELHCDPNLWEVFKKLHKKNDGTFVDARSQSINDDDSQEISINVNRLCLDIVGGEKKQRVYGLGSHASTLYPDSFSSSATSRRTATVIDNVTNERIRVLEEEIVRKKENQERILKQCIEDEVSRLRQQSEEQFRSM